MQMNSLPATQGATYEFRKPARIQPDSRPKRILGRELPSRPIPSSIAFEERYIAPSI